MFKNSQHLPTDRQIQCAFQAHQLHHTSSGCGTARKASGGVAGLIVTAGIILLLLFWFLIDTILK